MEYKKVPLSISEQITRLKERGLKFKNEAKAAHYLSNISYYRLRAYTYPFQNNDDTNHPFIKEVFFEDIIDLYCFDRRLRAIIFNAIEKIEVALRTKIIYHYAIDTNDAQWYENATLFKDQATFIKVVSRLYEEIERSSEVFIAHYKQKYSKPEHPPAWMSLEVVSIGLLSQLFSSLKNDQTKKKISKDFGLPQPFILESWVHSFTALRNLCAHHSRIWNRRLVVKPRLPYNTIYSFVDAKPLFANKIYARLCCIQYILKIISPGNSFSDNLKALLQASPLVDLKEMGFPEEWKSTPFWD